MHSTMNQVKRLVGVVYSLVRPLLAHISHTDELGLIVPALMLRSGWRCQLCHRSTGNIWQEIEINKGVGRGGGSAEARGKGTRRDNT